MANTKRTSPQDDPYMQDVHKYLTEVRENKRYFTQQDPYAPMFNQESGPLGTGRFVNPPTNQSWEQGHPPKGVWGFHEPTVTAGEAIGPAARQAGESLADPRNAWIGLGPMAALGKGARGLFRAKPNPVDAGGFMVPTRKMLLDDPHLSTSEAIRANSNSAPLWESENRADYLFGRNLENQAAADMRAGDPLQQIAADERYVGMLLNEQRNVNKVLGGQRQLSEEVTRGTMSRSGGGVPSEIDLKMFTDQDPRKFKFKSGRYTNANE